MIPQALVVYSTVLLAVKNELRSGEVLAGEIELAGMTRKHMPGLVVLQILGLRSSLYLGKCSA